MVFNLEISIFALLIFCKAASGLSKHKPLIVLSFDGFKADYLSQVPTPNLGALILEGVTVPYMQPQFPTKTFVNHQSIVTGLFAESHGVVDNIVYDPLYNLALSGFSHHNEEFWNFNDDVVPIWTLNEWAGDGRISGVQFPGCLTPYGRNRTLPTYTLKYKGRRLYQERVDYILDWLTNPTKPANLVLMYFNLLDTAGHMFGPQSSQVNIQIRRADSTIGYLIQQLKAKGIYDQVNLIVIGDHGMRKLEGQYNLQNSVDLDSTYYSMYGGSSVFQILPAKGQENLVFEAFKAASLQRNFQAFTKSEIPHRWHYKYNRRTLPMVVVANPGFAFGDANLKSQGGLHGFDNKDPQMRTIFIARGPAFKKGCKGRAINIVDLFSLFSHILGFAALPNNGTFSNVQELLN